MGRSACVCTHAIGWKTEGLEGAAPEACSSISTASVDPEPSIIGRCRHALAELGLAPPQSEALDWIIGPLLCRSFARRLGYEPRVAFLSYSTFGYPKGDRSAYVRAAVSELDKRNVDFEYDGEMGADVALSREAMAQYPFCRLTAPA